MGYKRFAQIPGIFICDFEDADEIDSELLGYAAIAKGLGVVSGSNGKLLPENTLTKGEAAVIIYNCLKSNLY